MFRLLTLVFSALCFASFVWFGLTVDLGQRTLFGHLRAIGNSEPAQDLWTGVKSKVNDFVGIEAARRTIEQDGADRPGSEGGVPQEMLDDGDRDRLRRLLEERTKKARADEPRKPGLAQAPERK